MHRDSRKSDPLDGRFLAALALVVALATALVPAHADHAPHDSPHHSYSRPALHPPVITMAKPVVHTAPG